MGRTLSSKSTMTHQNLVEDAESIPFFSTVVDICEAMKNIHSNMYDRRDPRQADLSLFNHAIKNFLLSSITLTSL